MINLDTIRAQTLKNKLDELEKLLNKKLSTKCNREQLESLPVEVIDHLITNFKRTEIKEPKQLPQTYINTEEHLRDHLKTLPFSIFSTSNNTPPNLNPFQIKIETIFNDFHNLIQTTITDNHIFGTPQELQAIDLTSIHQSFASLRAELEKNKNHYNILKAYTNHEETIVNWTPDTKSNYRNFKARLQHQIQLQQKLLSFFQDLLQATNPDQTYEYLLKNTEQVWRNSLIAYNNKLYEAQKYYQEWKKPFNEWKKTLTTNVNNALTEYYELLYSLLKEQFTNGNQITKSDCQPSFLNHQSFSEYISTPENFKTFLFFCKEYATKLTEKWEENKSYCGLEKDDKINYDKLRTTFYTYEKAQSKLHGILGLEFDEFFNNIKATYEPYQKILHSVLANRECNYLSIPTGIIHTLANSDLNQVPLTKEIIYTNLLLHFTPNLPRGIDKNNRRVLEKVTVNHTPFLILINENLCRQETISDYKSSAKTNFITQSLTRINTPYEQQITPYRKLLFELAVEYAKIESFPKIHQQSTFHLDKFYTKEKKEEVDKKQTGLTFTGPLAYPSARAVWNVANEIRKNTIPTPPLDHLAEYLAIFKDHKNFNTLTPQDLISYKLFNSYSTFSYSSGYIYLSFNDYEQIQNLLRNQFALTIPQQQQTQLCDEIAIITNEHNSNLALTHCTSSQRNQEIVQHSKSQLIYQQWIALLEREKAQLIKITDDAINFTEEWYHQLLKRNEAKYEGNLKKQKNTLDSGWTKELQNLEDKRIQDLKALEDKRIQDLKALEDQKNKDLKALEDKRIQDLKALEDQKNRKLQNLEDQKNKELQNLEDQKNRKLQNLEDQKNRKLQNLEELKAACEEDFHQLRRDLNEINTTAPADYRAGSSVYPQQIIALNNEKHRAELLYLETTYKEALKYEYQNRIETLEEQLTKLKETAILEEQYQDDRYETQSATIQQLQAQKNEHEQLLARNKTLIETLQKEQPTPSSTTTATDEETNNFLLQFLPTSTPIISYLNTQKHVEKNIQIYLKNILLDADLLPQEQKQKIEQTIDSLNSAHRQSQSQLSYLLLFTYFICSIIISFLISLIYHFLKKPSIKTTVTYNPQIPPQSPPLVSNHPLNNHNPNCPNNPIKK